MPSSLHLVLAFLISTLPASVLASGADNSSVAVAIDCCTLVRTLYRYMSVDDKYIPCTQGDEHCTSLRLIRLFMQHSSTTLDTRHPALVRGSDIIFHMPTDVNLAPLLVFAFFGRSVSPADESDVDMWLSYDTKLNKIRFEDSTCELNRNVYTTLVLASLVLLMFFIAVQMAQETQEQQAAPVASASVPDNPTIMVPKSPDIVFKHLIPNPRLRFMSSDFSRK